MNGWEIVVGIVLGLAVNEMCDLSPWLAKRLVHWSAHVQYGDGERAELRAVEWISVIDSRPGKLFKLFTAVAFMLGASFARTQGTMRAARLIQTILTMGLLALVGSRSSIRIRPSTKVIGARRYYRRGHWVNAPRKRK